MATTEVTSDDWASVTLSQNEIWQVREGAILVSNETPADAEDGIEMTHGLVMFFSDGETVHYRRHGGLRSAKTILLVRKPDSYRLG